VSAFTARQVEQLLHVEPSRIRVVQHGTRRTPAPTNVSREPIILSVGAIQRRKNITRLVESFERIDPGWKLFLAGSFGFEAEETLQRIALSSRKHDIHVLDFVPNRELEALYQRASIFAFPSLAEGFGMPVLDAMARGVPVLTSNVSAMPEVAGDAAVLVDPGDVTSIAEGLQRLTKNSELRDTLIQRGLARAKEFTWEKSVNATWDVYQELLT